MSGAVAGVWGLPLALVGGALRVSTPYLFVSLGECLTEKSGRVNLGQEGTLIMGAMTAYGVSYLSGSPWLGVLAAGWVGVLFGALHAWLCTLPRVNDIAVGIALMLLGIGTAFFLGKPLIQPRAARLSAFELGAWSDSAPVRAALEVTPLFLLGIAAAFAMRFFFERSRWGLVVRVVGEDADAARALGYPVGRVRFAATAAGGFLAGVGGSFLSLYYPGSWSEGLSSGQGLMAVALVIFARWDPVRCLWASLLFGGAGAVGPALQSIGILGGYHLYAMAPYVLTFVIMIITSSARRTLAGQPAELTVAR
ncbi:MAG TPA: ABC transporter permease [Polyangiaceae bacterium]|nr:ABC transporter permease [Polyangiaceae bacterium]